MSISLYTSLMVASLTPLRLRWRSSIRSLSCYPSGSWIPYVWPYPHVYWPFNRLPKSLPTQYSVPGLSKNQGWCLLPNGRASFMELCELFHRSGYGTYAPVGCAMYWRPGFCHGPKSRNVLASSKTSRSSGILPATNILKARRFCNTGRKNSLSLPLSMHQNPELPAKAAYGVLILKRYDVNEAPHFTKETAFQVHIQLLLHVLYGYIISLCKRRRFRKSSRITGGSFQGNDVL